MVKLVSNEGKKMSVLIRPEGDEIAASYGNDYFSLSQAKEIAVGQRFEVLCRDERHYRAEVKQFDPVSGLGVLHFCHWSTAYDYKGSLYEIYISPDGLYSNGQLTKLNTYPSESSRSRRRASTSSYSAEHRASKAFLENTRYPDDFLSKPYFTFRLKPGTGDDHRSDSGESAATSAKRRRRASVPSMPTGNSSSSDNIQNGSGIDNSADDLPKHALLLALAGDPDFVPPLASSPLSADHRNLDVIHESSLQRVGGVASSMITEREVQPSKVAAALSCGEEGVVRPVDERTAVKSLSAPLVIPLRGHSAKADVTPSFSSFPSHLITILQSLQLPDSLARLRDALPHSLVEEKSEGSLYSAGNVMKLLQVRQYLDDVLLRILNHHLAAESQNTNHRNR